MKLTPLDIRQKEFKRGMRGYLDAEVDEFLDAVADDFERLFKANVELSDHLDTLKQQLAHYQNIEETLQQTLVSAQKTAEQLKESAQKEAQLMLREAELRARDLVTIAERNSREMVGQAESSKQAIDKEMTALRNTEADFRARFKQLLDGFIKDVDAFEAPARLRAGEFARHAEALKAAIASGRPREGRAEASATMAAAPSAPAPVAEPAGEPALEAVAVEPAADVIEPTAAATESAAPEMEQAEAQEPAAAAAEPEVAAAVEPEDTAESAPAEAETPPAERDETEAAGDRQTPPRDREAAKRPWWEPEPLDADEAGIKAARPPREPLVDSEDPTLVPAQKAARPDEQSGRHRFPEDDDFLADADDRVGGNEFKW